MVGGGEEDARPVTGRIEAQVMDDVSGDLADIAVKERRLPRRFMSRDGLHLSAAGRAYLAPLVEGEDFPPFKGGLPQYPDLRLERVRRRLPR